MRRFNPIVNLAVASICVWTLGANSQTINNHAGNGDRGFSGDNGHPNIANLNFPAGIHGDSTSIYVADTGNHVIRRITPMADTIVTVAGTGGVAGYSGNSGIATSATLNSPSDVFVSYGDSIASKIYIADTGNHTIRAIGTDGKIATIAGTGIAGFSGDSGIATNATLNSPSGVFVTASGTIYIADTGNNRIRRVVGDTITTIAGTDTAGFGGDGDLAINAKLNAPSDVYLDTTGTIYIADTNNHRIRAISPRDTINTVAGTYSGGFSGDGNIPTNAELAFPEAVFLDSAGNIYIADRFNHRIRRVHIAGNIATLVGDGTLGHSGDSGAANLAQTASPSGIFVNESGQIFFSDTQNHRVRRVETDNVSGPTEATITSPLRQTQILDVSITGDGLTAVRAITLTVSDLSVATGLSNTDFRGFRLYESADSLLDKSDTHIGSIDSIAVIIGQAFTIFNDQITTLKLGETRHYLVSALIAPIASENVTFQVSFDPGGLLTNKGSWTSRKLLASDSNQIMIDIVATKLIFSTKPAGSISGNQLLTQPVISAIDDSGLVDTDFSDVISLSHSGAGNLLNSSATANKGIATFHNVTYIAASDDEIFVLTADDQVGGSEGDLMSTTSEPISSNSENDPPVANFQPFVMNEDDSLSFPVSAFISDVDDSILTIDFTSDHIVATVVGDQIILTPESNFFGIDTLFIVVTDPFGARASDTSEIEVKPLNDPTVLIPLGDVVFDEDDTLEIDLSTHAHDVDDEFTNIRWDIDSSPGLEVSFDSNSGLLNLWTLPDSSGEFSLYLSVRDLGIFTDSDTSKISILPVNDSPSISVSDTTLISSDILVINLRDVSTDVDSDINTLIYSATSPDDIVVTITDGGIAIIEPSSEFAGVDTITFMVQDPSGASFTDTMTITTTDFKKEVKADSIVVGDFDANSTIDLKDFFQFADHFGLSIIDANWNPIFDLDVDGLIGLTDFFLFADQFQLSQTSR